MSEYYYITYCKLLETSKYEGFTSFEFGFDFDQEKSFSLVDHQNFAGEFHLVESLLYVTDAEQ